MTVKTLKTIERVIHLVAAAVLGTYLYSPLIDDDTWTLIVRAVVIPVLGVSGVVIWQAPRVVRAIRSVQG